MNILIFGELVSSNNFFYFLLEKLHLATGLTGLGNYLQGLPIQNNVDFIWGTESGIRTLPVSFFLFLLQIVAKENWYWIYLLAALFLPFVCFYIALCLYKKQDLFIVIGACFYAFNTWIIDRLTSGYWQLNVVYAFLPFLLVIPLRVAKKTNFKKKFLLFWSTLFALISSLVMLGQPHFLLMVALFLLLHIILLVMKKRKKQVINLISFYIVSFLIFLLINTYFFVPSLFFSEKTFTAPSQYFSLGSVLFNGTGSTLLHVLQLSPLAFPFISSPMHFVEWVQFLQLVLVGVFFLTNKKRNWLLATCLIIFVFLAKGLNSPFTQLSSLFYKYIPILHFFRDPPRFIGAIVLFGAMIIGLYSRRLQKSVLPRAIIVAVVVAILFVANWRELQGKLKTTLTETHIPSQYLSMQKYINTNLSSSGGRLLIIPNSSGYAGYSFYHDSPLPSTLTIYDMTLPLQVPLADSSNYPDNYSSEMSSLIYKQFTTTYDMHDLTAVGISYILTDSAITNAGNEKYIATTSAKELLANSNFPSMKSIQNLRLFMDKNPAPLLTTEQPIFAIGNLQTILKIHEAGITRPVILLDQAINTNFLGSSVLRNQEVFLDTSSPVVTVTAEELAKKYAVDILQSAWDYDKSLQNCEPYKMAYTVLQGNLFTSGRCVESGYKTGFVDVPINIPKGSYKVLLKAVNTQGISHIDVQIGKKILHESIATKGDLKWIDLGTQEISTQQQTMRIHVKDKNPLAIDYLIFIPTQVWDKQIKINQNLLLRMKITTLQDLKNVPNTKKSTGIGSDTVTVPKTSYLTYRFSWGKWWRSDKPSINFISDGYGMTFIATGEKISSISYFPDKIYLACIAFSMLTMLSGILYVGGYVFSKKRFVQNKKRK